MPPPATSPSRTGRCRSATRSTFSAASGSGKTHLMHAIWHAIRERDPKTRVLYLTAESFVNRFIQALRTKNTGQFKELFRNVDVLMVDDVQFICGKEASQDEFFFTFNSLVEQNKQIVLSLREAAQRAAGHRGAHALAAGQRAGRRHPFRRPTSCGSASCRPRRRQARVPVPIAVLEFLAHKISTNIRELEGALNRVVAHGQLIGREITVEMAQDVLHDLLRQADRKVTVDEIQQRVAAHYNIKLAEMSSPRRARSVARPRQVAMYLAKQLTTAQPAADRQALRQPRPHHGHACRAQDRGAQDLRPVDCRGCRVAQAAVAGLTLPGLRQTGGCRRAGKGPRFGAAFSP